MYIRWWVVISFTTAFFSLGCRQSKGNKFIQLAGARATLQQIGEPAGSPLEPRVREIFSQKCFGCHGKDGANSGNIGDIRNFSALREKKLVIIGKPEESKIYTRLVSNQQPMPPPPAALLPASEIEVIKAWILEKPDARQKLSYESVYKTIEQDFNALPADEKVDTRYFHLVNNYNAGMPDDGLEQVRKGLSKMLNMLSTSDKIQKPTPIDDKNLIYRVNLRDYELDRPETMFTHMIKTIYPKYKDDAEWVEKWLPDPQDRKADNYYGGRYKEVMEGKKSESKFLKASDHTFVDGLPMANHPILTKMARAMREAAQKSDATSLVTFGHVSAQEKADSKRCQEEENPAGIECSNPLPLVRADWFISQISGNMRMRLYYHASGMDDDTVTLDAALGIDDEEGFLVDNDPEFVESQFPKEKRIIRAGFNNSGVSSNHRAIERIPLEYVPGKPLWRGFEFKDKSKPEFTDNDLFNFPAGPIFGISNDDEVGHECINLMTPRYTILDGVKVRTMALVDGGLLYPSTMPNNKEPLIVRELKNTSITGERRAELEEEFEALFGHNDFVNWRSADYMRVNNNSLPIRQNGPFAGKAMIQCELNVPIQQWPEGLRNNPIAHRHDTLEYLFLKRNGLQGFVNVGLQAEHIDYKIPNQRALDNKTAVLIPAHDAPNLFVVGAPLSCLSCHVQGYIEKEDQIKQYVDRVSRPESVTPEFWTLFKEKIARLNVPFDQFKSQMELDNNVFRKALSETGVDYKDPEPIVDTYRSWAISGMTFTHVAEELELTEAELARKIKFNSKIAKYLNEFIIDGAIIKRSEFEKAYRPLMCEIHASCKTIDAKNLIPN